MKLVIEPHILENAFSKNSAIHNSLTLELYSLFRVAKRHRKIRRENTKAKTENVRIFISYKWIDRNWMILIRKNLKRAGYEYWVDEERLKPGSRWREEIKKEINKATLFISIYSTYACVSDGVFQQELREAFAQQEERGGTFIIPVLPEKVDMEKIPRELKGLNFLHLSKEGWMEDLKQEIQDVLKRRTDLASVEEQLSKPEICLDDPPGDSKIALKYREIYSSNKKFEEWNRRIRFVEGFRYVMPNVDPALENDLKSKKRKGCRGEGSEIYIRTTLGARGGHLVSEGGVKGKCEQNHKWDACPTRDLLRRDKGEDFVLSANTALLRVQELRERLENQIKEWRRSKKELKI